MESYEVFSKNTQQRKIRARGPSLFWAVRDLEISLTDAARQLEMSIPGVGYTMEREEAIVQHKGYKLID